MIGLEDRQQLARDIDEACKAGARLKAACEVAGVDARTLQRWKAGDGLRPKAPPAPSGPGTRAFASCSGPVQGRSVACRRSSLSFPQQTSTFALGFCRPFLAWLFSMRD
jgi:hypothetical protein